MSVKKPTCKVCRRAGEKLCNKGDRWSTGRCATVKRNYPPGVHGPKGKPRLTDYGSQLRDKQKVKQMYGLREQQFVNYFKKAMNQKGDSGQNLIQMLEGRLDNVIYRLGFALTRAEARQRVVHSHFKLNGKKMNIPSYQVKPGEVISIREKSFKRTKLFTDIKKHVEMVDTPSWLHIDTTKEYETKVISAPDVKNLMELYNIKAIIEFYSR